MKMRGLAVVACMVAVATASHGTHAEPINMSKLTCIGYSQASDPGGANFDVDGGYFVAQAGEIVFDTDRHIAAARQLGYLWNNPNAFVIEIYRRALTDNSSNL
jgi:hypothetical protein